MYICCCVLESCISKDIGNNNRNFAKIQNSAKENFIKIAFYNQKEAQAYQYMEELLEMNAPKADKLEEALEPDTTYDILELMFFGTWYNESRIAALYEPDDNKE